MNFLNQAATQLNDLFRSMTPAARITSALLLAVVLISLIVLFRFPPATSQDYLLGGHVFTANDLMGAQGALAKAGLQCEVEGNRIRVPRGQQAACVAALVDAGALPRHIGSWWKEYDEKSSLFESHKHADIRMKLALQQELAQVLRKMEGIAHASVFIGEVKTDGLARETERTASVAIEPMAGADLAPDRIRSIRHFVAGAVRGLKPNDVTIMDMNSGDSYPGDGDSAVPTAENDHYAARVRWWEQWWTKKIKELLGDIHGVKVAANVLLDTHLQSRQSSVKFDPQIVATKTEYTNTVERITGREANGGDGAMANATANQHASIAQAPDPETDTTHEREIQEGIASHEQNFSEKAPLTPQRVTVSVAVPRSHYRRVWESQNQTQDGPVPAPPDEKTLQEIENTTKRRIQETIVNLLPQRPSGDDEYPLVNVTTLDDTAAPPLPQPGVVREASSWLGRNWSTLGMMGIGLAGLLFLRGLVRNIPKEPKPPSDLRENFSVVHPEGDEREWEHEDFSEMSVKRKRRLPKSRPNPREELAEMVNEDPDTAAAILRSWIGEAS